MPFYEERENKKHTKEYFDTASVAEFAASQLFSYSHAHFQKFFLLYHGKKGCASIYLDFQVHSYLNCSILY